MSYQDKRFGELLSEGISSAAKRQQKSMAAIEQEMAEVVGYSRPMLQKWRQGRYLPEDEVVKELVHYCVTNGRVNRQWADSLLIQARYPDREQLLTEIFSGYSLSNEEAPRSDKNWTEPEPAYLESPHNIVPIQSQFYVERPGDRIALKAIARQGVTIIIKGPPQMGKSSLLLRVEAAAEQAGKRVAFLDFQQFDRSSLAEADTFFQQFCILLTDKLEVDNRVNDCWALPLGNRQRLTRYLSHYLLPELGRPVVLAMDETDVIFNTDFRDDFFGTLRSWHSSRAHSAIWQQLDLVLVTSTEPYLFIKDLDESPFNVGEVIVPADFTVEQVIELNQKHGTPLSTRQVQQLFELLGGHPYLVRLALYLVVEQRFSPASLFSQAIEERGPFGDHLRHHLTQLRRQRELVESLRQVITHHTCPDQHIFFRLWGAGLVRREGQAVLPRCQLYASFFGKYLYD
jgi:hypothetical protein